MDINGVSHRRIRSFVRRSGRRTVAQRRLVINDLQRFELPHNPTPFFQVFENHNPVVLEVGFGNGESLVQTALANPGYNYLGVEVYESGIGRFVGRLIEMGIVNVRIANKDAVEIIETHVDTDSLLGVQIFFPDPWPKKRHHKRRLIQLQFLDTIATKVSVGGFLHLATDWGDYAEGMMETLEQHPLFGNFFESFCFAPSPFRRPETAFEVRGQGLGHRIYDLYFKRI